MISSHTLHAAPFKVLVVMSYEEEFPWCGEVREGIDAVLSQSGEIRYFYMNTKSDLAGGAKKAEEAYSVYLKLQADGVIAVDDNAQSMFVVPYLKDKVATPVMFCGVNAEPEKYGYPAVNVSGILERPHFGESFAFAQQLVPSIKNVGFIIKDSPTGQAHFSQIQREAGSYPVTLSGFMMPRTVAEIVSMTCELRETSDALLVAALAGVLDESGKPVSEKEGVKIALDIFGNKPVIGAESYTVNYGALCTVVRTGQEQGETSARMLLKAIKGTPLSLLPITQNYKGKRIINATVMKALGIKPRPEILRGAELVRTEE
ncbi:ABC transporter substrate-binding protein [Desulfamplus magnetovallimortis]|nr:ABC transporter substrate binding protein [Desulfamplus magnetovallimortis]